MNSKFLSAIFFFALFGGLLLFSFDVNRVAASSGTIIVPDQYPTIQQAINAANPGDTIFVKNGTYQEHLIVDKGLNLTGENKDATIIDGGGVGTCVKVTSHNVGISGFFITNSGNGTSDSGLLLDRFVENCTVRDNRIVGNNGNGIFLNQTGYNTRVNVIDSNYIDRNNLAGIVLNTADQVHVSNNGLDGNGVGILLDNSSRNNLIFKNNITESHQNGITGRTSGLNYFIENIVENSVYNGVGLYNCSQNDLSQNRVTNSSLGVLLDTCSNNTVHENIVNENGDTGIKLTNSAQNTVSNNTATNNTAATLLDNSSNNTIRRNDMKNNYAGVVLENNSTGNLIDINDLVHESESAVWIYNSSNNKVTHNSLEGFSLDVQSTNSVNEWDSGSSFSDGGNYWINYTGPDLDRDGIGDSPKVLDANNVDHYPLMGPFSSFNFSQGLLEIITNSAIEDLSYFDTNNTVLMHVSNMTASQTSAFARFAIPRSLMDVSNISIVIDDGLTPILYSNYSLYDNGTYRWIYVEFPMSTHKIDVIPETSFTVLPFVMMATAITLMFCRRRRRAA